MIRNDFAKRILDQYSQRLYACLRSLAWTAPILEEEVPDWQTEFSVFPLDHSSSSVNKWNNETLSDFFTSLFQDQRIMFAPKMFHRNSDSMNKSNFDTISHPLLSPQISERRKQFGKQLKAKLYFPSNVWSQMALEAYQPLVWLCRIIVSNDCGNDKWNVQDVDKKTTWDGIKILCIWQGWMFMRWTI